MNFIEPAINQYIENQYLEKDAILQEMQRYGEARDFPLIGPQVGRLLFILAKLSRAKRVLEMGSGYGYSAYWFAKALPAGGKVFQTEYSKENSEKSRAFFKKGKLLHKTEFFVGDAFDAIKKNPGKFDIVLLDLGKEDYPAAFKEARKRIAPGGLLIADNTLWFSKVLDKKPEASTKGILKFTKLLFSDKSFFSTIVPVRDGVAVGFKTK